MQPDLAARVLCGGKNHGTHKMVEVIKEVGRAPKAAKGRPKALDRAAQYLGCLWSVEATLNINSAQRYHAYKSGLVDR
jgi:hypothetical protein